MTRRPSVRPGPRRTTGWALVVLAVVEVGLVGWWVTSGSTLLFLLGQLLVATLLALVLVWDRYLRFRHAFERDIAHRAVQRQRSELAEELHDVLGHELSLIAVRAGALQVSTTGPVAEQAAELRGQVEQTVLQLRQTVQLLHDGGPAPVDAEPAALDVSSLITRARDAGADITTSGSIGAAVPAPVRLTAYRLVQEGLTNAAKHAPGRPVTVGFDQLVGALEITVETRGPGRGESGGESGIGRLRRRIEAIGGELDVRIGAEEHLIRAVLPLAGSAPLLRPTAEVERVPEFSRPGPATVRWALVRGAALLALCLGFYTWATDDATLEPAVFERLHVGLPIGSAGVDLPRRQAPIRFDRGAPVPAGWHCRTYTEGNFPFGLASFEICDDGTRLTRVDDLRRTPWR